MSGREFEIIERYFAGLGSAGTDHVVLGPGDDCAILDVPADAELCISTDTLIEGTHFPENVSGKVVAHRSLIANLSDLAAMGATPFAFTLALTLPGEDDAWLHEFSTSLQRLSGIHEMPLVGGNLAKGPLSITITVLGTVPKHSALRRRGAKVGDDIYVTGTIGDAGGGLTALKQDPGASGHLVDRYYYPEARLEFGSAIRAFATAGIDISDGLIADLSHICKASGVGANLNLDLLPVSAELVSQQSDREARVLALSAGDDYELCFTAPSAAAERILQSGQDIDVLVTPIGKIVEGDKVVVRDSSGRTIESAEGYQHFHG